MIRSLLFAALMGVGVLAQNSSAPTLPPTPASAGNIVKGLVTIDLATASTYASTWGSATWLAANNANTTDIMNGIQLAMCRIWNGTAVDVPSTTLSWAECEANKAAVFTFVPMAARVEAGSAKIYYSATLLSEEIQARVAGTSVTVYQTTVNAALTILDVLPSAVIQLTTAETPKAPVTTAVAGRPFKCTMTNYALANCNGASATTTSMRTTSSGAGCGLFTTNPTAATKTWSISNYYEWGNAVMVSSSAATCAAGWPATLTTIDVVNPGLSLGACYSYATYKDYVGVVPNFFGNLPFTDANYALPFFSIDCAADPDSTTTSVSSAVTVGFSFLAMAGAFFMM